MLKKTVLYSAFWLSLSGLILQMLGFLYRIVISRMAGAQGMALYQLIWPFYGIISSVSISGLCAAAVKLTAEKESKKDNTVYLLIKTCIRLFMCIFALVSVAAIFSLKWISETVLGDTRIYPVLLVIIPTLFLTGFENIYKSFFHGTHNVIPVVISEISELLIRIAAGFALMLIFKNENPATNALLIALGMLISEFFSSVFLHFIYKNKIKSQKLINDKSKNSKQVKQILSFAAPVAGSGLLLNIINSATLVMIPRLLMMWGMQKHDAMNTFGVLLGMVSPFLMFPMIFISSLSNVIFPNISHLRASGRQKDVNRKISLSIFVTGIFSLPITAVIITAGPYFCNFLFKQNPDKSFFAALAAVSVFSYYEMLLSNILNGLGKEKQNALFAIISGVIQLIATCIAIPLLGIYGYAAGIFCGSFFRFTACMILIFIERKIKIEVTKWFLSPVITASLCGVLGKQSFELMLRNNFSEFSAIVYMIAGTIILYTILMNIQGIRPIKYAKSLL